MDEELHKIKVCNSCGQIYSKKCDCSKPKNLLSKVPMPLKVLACAGIASASLIFLPATIATLIAGGAIMGLTLTMMLVIPLSESQKMWMAQHPRVFMMLHIPLTVGIAMLGEGMLLAFSNLIGGAIATAYLIHWGTKHGLTWGGKKTPEWIAPEKEYSPSAYGVLKCKRASLSLLSAILNV
jgi:hypothetical protein